MNDHWLRWNYPSWWTGKIGDAAWLFFAPFALAVLLARFLPGRDRLTGALSVVLVGLVFGLVKTLPVAHQTFAVLFKGVLGWEPILRRDPTDLLALPALWLSWRLWTGLHGRQRSVPRRAWLALPVAVLATVANSGPPDPGISCLAVEQGRILAVTSGGASLSYHGSFVSDDGGLTWQDIDSTEVISIKCQERQEPWTIAGSSSNELYRFTPGQVIERLVDGGEHWTTEIGVSESDIRAARQHYVGTGRPPRGPEDAVIDPVTGNLVVAMEWKGVLVRLPDGEWRWIEVGDYGAN